MNDRSLPHAACIAFRMQLNPGTAAEYRARHDAIWPELVGLLHDTGVSDYSIFLDEPSGTLFAVLTTRDVAAIEQLADSPVMQRWWQYMRDIMTTDGQGMPTTYPLERVFHMD